MKKFNAEKIYAIAALFGELGQVSQILIKQGVGHGVVPVATVPDILDNVRQAQVDALVIGLKLSNISLDALLSELEEEPVKITVNEFSQAIAEISHRIHDELSCESFLHVSADHQKYYDGSRKMFGDTVADAFPSSQNDIEEAGKCLATERGTACVFHLMRALSPVTQAIADSLGIGAKDNWGTFLQEMRDAFWKKFPDDKTEENTSRRIFYSDIECHLRAIKDAWRNTTMHSIAAIYTEAQAETIFQAVKGLMQKASSGIKEQP